MAEQQNQNKNANAKEQDIHQLLKVRREKLAELQAEGKDPFQITKYDQDTHSADIKDNYAEYDGKEVSIAGRIMSKRVMGKASFCNVQDLKGNIQCYVSRDELGDDSYKDFKKMDIGAAFGATLQRNTGSLPAYPVSSKSSLAAPAAGSASVGSMHPAGSSKRICRVPWRYWRTKIKSPSTVTATTTTKSGTSFT